MTSTIAQPSSVTLTDMPIHMIEEAAWFPPTVIHIPSRALSAVARLLASLIGDVNRRAEAGISADNAPLRAALRYVLYGDRTTTEKTIRARANFVLAGKWDALAGEIPSSKNRLPEPTSDARQLAKACRLASAGNIRRARLALPSGVKARPFTMDDVIGLYPDPALPQGTGLQHVPRRMTGTTSYLKSKATPQLPWKKTVWDEVRRFSAETQPGPSGLRPEHLRATVQRIGGLDDAVADVIDHIVAGRVRGPFLTDSVLGMIPKTIDTYRPIGIGEIFRRISARLVASEMRARYGWSLEAAGQYGQATEGTARAHDLVRQDVQDTKTVYQLDIVNAFNTLERAPMIEAIPIDDPAATLIHQLYGSQNDLVIPSLRTRFTQSRGVVQGCPIAGLLFSITLMGPIQRINAAHPSTMSRWYADDGHVTTNTIEELDRYMHELGPALGKIGLTLAPEKCRLLTSVTSLQGAQQSIVGSDQITGVLQVLGGPVVAPSNTTKTKIIDDDWQRRLQKVRSSVGRLKLFKHPQLVVRALSLTGAWSRVEHAATLAALDGRQIPQEVLADLAGIDRGVLESVLETKLTQDAWTRACLPIRSGGLGIRDPTIECQFGSNRVNAIRKANNPSHFPPPQSKEQIKAERLRLYDERLTALLCELPANTHRGAVLRDIVAGAPQLWVTRPASNNDGTLLPEPVARCAILAYLGQPVFEEDKRTECFCHGRPVLVNKYGDHVGGCYNYLSDRHNKIRDLIASAARHAFGASSVHTEVDADEIGRPFEPGVGRRPGDISYFLNGKWHFIDVTVQSPIPAFLARQDRIGPDNGPLAEFGEHAKHKRNAPDVARFADKPCTFVFFGVGAYGSISRNAYRVIESIGHALESKKDYPVDPRTFLRWKIQIALWTKIGTNIYDLRRRSPVDLIQRRRLPQAAHMPPHRGRALNMQVQSPQNTSRTACTNGADTMNSALQVVKRHRQTNVIQPSVSKSRRLMNDPLASVLVDPTRPVVQGSATQLARSLYRTDVDDSQRPLQSAAAAAAAQVGTRPSQMRVDETMDDDVDKHPDASDDPTRAFQGSDPGGTVNRTVLQKSGTTTPMVGNEGAALIDNHRPNAAEAASAAEQCTISFG